jgi:hypothetical protein
MSTRKDAGARVALLQGTLDLLILRTLVFGRQHGQGIARFYTLTRLGRRQLVAETRQWRRLAAAIAGILGPGEA